MSVNKEFLQAQAIVESVLKEDLRARGITMVEDFVTYVHNSDGAPLAMEVTTTGTIRVIHKECE